MAALHLHASCVLIGDKGVLIRGRSGAGKSSLARALLAEAAARGLFARLIGDDRIAVEPVGGRLIAAGHPAVSGLIEARGVGPVATPGEARCVLRLVVDLLDGPAGRLPEGEDRQSVIAGVALPRLALGPGPDRAELALVALSQPC